MNKNDIHFKIADMEPKWKSLLVLCHIHNV